MPFDAYSGTISQLVDRIVQNLQSTGSFQIVATWGTTFRWYALQYTDPDGVSTNNGFLIIGPHTMRATVGTTPVEDYITCNTDTAYGRPHNFYGFSVIFTNNFNPANFTFTPNASTRATYVALYVRHVVTSYVSGTPCNDDTVPRTYEDLPVTAYYWYDKYGFAGMFIPTAAMYIPLGALHVTYRARPLNPSIHTPNWWVSISDQVTYTERLDTYYSDNPPLTQYPTNLCGFLPWTTSSTARGLCADVPASYNHSPAISSMVSAGRYFHVYNVHTTFVTPCCSTRGFASPRAPGSLWRHIASSSLPMLIDASPAHFSSLDNRVYIRFPLLAIDTVGRTGSSLDYATRDPIYGILDVVIPAPPAPARIYDFDVITLPDGRQYIAITHNVSHTFSLCNGGYHTGYGYNTNALRYFIRYA